MTSYRMDLQPGERVVCRRGAFAGQSGVVHAAVDAELIDAGASHRPYCVVAFEVVGGAYVPAEFLERV